MIDQLANGVINVCCIAIALCILRVWLNKLGKEVKELADRFNILSISLPKDYADKQITRESIDKIWLRLDGDLEKIAKLEERTSGSNN